MLTLVERPVVCDVETIGDWIKLSSAIRHLEFWLVALNLCEVPIPTLVSSIGIAIFLRAFSAVDASWILSSPTLIAYRSISIGKNSVLPTPGIFVNPIPMEEVIPPFLS